MFEESILGSDLSTENEAHDFISRTKKTFESEKNTSVRECFEYKLRKVEIDRFMVYTTKDVTFKFLNTLLLAMRGVTVPMFNGMVKDDLKMKDVGKLPEFIQSF